MKAVVCKHPVADYGGNMLFLKGSEYKVVGVDKLERVLVKDELGCLRLLATKEKFFKEHFVKAKE